ncbi:MAG: PIN domain-containing protein [Acidimicrobiia bacterium]
MVTVGELSLGALRAGDVDSRARRMSTLELVMTLSPLPIDEEAAGAWARLGATLRESGRRMPPNDSWVAATAAAHRLPVLTCDADFRDLPGGARERAVRRRVRRIRRWCTVALLYAS